MPGATNASTCLDLLQVVKDQMVGARAPCNKQELWRMGISSVLQLFML